MGGMSLMHWVIILVIVLVVFGPSRLPSLGKSVGEAIRGFKKGLNGDEIDVTHTTRNEQLRSSDQPTAQKASETEKHHS